MWQSPTNAKKFINQAKVQVSHHDILESLIRAVDELNREVQRVSEEVRRFRREMNGYRRRAL